MPQQTNKNTESKKFIFGDTLSEKKQKKNISNDINYSKYSNKKIEIKGKENKHNLYGSVVFPTLTKEDNKKYDEYLEELNNIFSLKTKQKDSDKVVKDINLKKSDILKKKEKEKFEIPKPKEKMKGGVRLTGAAPGAVPAGLNRQLVNILQTVHQKVESGVGLTGIVNFSLNPVVTTGEYGTNPNNRDLILWVHNDDGLQSTQAIAIKVDVNVFDTPRSIETNPYLGNNHPETPAGAGVIGTDRTRRNTEDNYNGTDIEKIVPLLYNADPVNNMNQPMGLGGGVTERITNPANQDWNHFLLYPDYIRSLNVQRMGQRNAQLGNPRTPLFKSLGLINFAHSLISGTNHLRDYKFQELKIESNFCHKLNIFLNNNQPLDFNYSYGLSTDFEECPELEYLQYANPPVNTVNRDSSVNNYVYCVNRERYGPFSNHIIAGTMPPNYVVSALAYRGTLQVGQGELDSEFQNFAEVIVPGKVNYCIEINRPKFSGYFARDYNDKVDKTTREDIRTIQAITYHWDQLMNPFCYSNVPVGNWINYDAVQRIVFGLASNPTYLNEFINGVDPQTQMIVRRTIGHLGTTALPTGNADERAAVDIVIHRLDRELTTMCAKFDKYFYSRARLTMKQGTFRSETFIDQQGNGSATPANNYQGRSYSGVYSHISSWGNQTPGVHNILYRGSSDAYRFHSFQYDANGNIIHNWNPNMAGSIMAHENLVLPGPGVAQANTKRRILHLSYMHTSHSIDSAYNFAQGQPGAAPGCLYIIHLVDPQAHCIPYHSFDFTPGPSQYGPLQGYENEVLFPRNCIWEIDTSLIPRNQVEEAQVYGNGSQVQYVQGSPWHLIRRGNGQWVTAIHCKLLPPHNSIFNIDQHIIKKKLAERIVFDFNESPQLSILANSQIENLHHLRKKIIEWFSREKQNLINPHTGNYFNYTAEIINSTTYTLGNQANNLYEFGKPNNHPNPILGGKKKKKKKTKKKNRKTKHKTSRKKR